jgi:hypothetical protein
VLVKTIDGSTLSWHKSGPHEPWTTTCSLPSQLAFLRGDFTKLRSQSETLVKQQIQLFELREYAERRGWSIWKQYVDRGISGSTDSRPALNEMMADAQRRRIDCILVWKIDRFGRLILSPLWPP